MKNLVWLAVAWVVAIGLGGVASAQAPAGVGTGALAEARVFASDEGSVRKMANGGQSRDIVYGNLATG